MPDLEPRNEDHNESKMSATCVDSLQHMLTAFSQSSSTLFERWGSAGRALHPLVMTVSTHTSSRLHRVRLSPLCLSTSDLDRESEGLLWLGTRSNHTWVCNSSSSWRAAAMRRLQDSLADQLFKKAPLTASLSVNNTSFCNLTNAFERV